SKDGEKKSDGDKDKKDGESKDGEKKSDGDKDKKDGEKQPEAINQPEVINPPAGVDPSPLSFRDLGNGSIEIRDVSDTSLLNLPASENSGAKLVVMRPGQAPVVEKAYEIKLKNDAVTLRPVDSLDQNYQGSGNLISSTKLTIKTPAGGNVDFTVSMKQGGMEIKPLNADSAKFIEENRSAVVGSGALSVARDLKISVDKIETIFLDLR
ncbi:MAG: hypothetical protein RJB18_1245, partial [Pseudomonadota bacterium]